MPTECKIAKFYASYVYSSFENDPDIQEQLRYARKLYEPKTMSAYCAKFGTTFSGDAEKIYSIFKEHYKCASDDYYNEECSI